MKWKLLVRPEAVSDVSEAASWYDSKREGLGDEFTEAVISTLNEIEADPLIERKRHPTKDVRWRIPIRFPYRVVYQALPEDQTIVVACLLHAARHDRNWKKRV